MRPILPGWAILLFVAILFMAGLFWVRGHPGKSVNPLEESVQDLSDYLGFEVEPTAPPAGPENGLLVKAVHPGTPAEHAGVKAGDRIVAVGDRSVWHATQLQQLMSPPLVRGGGCPVLLQKGQEFRMVGFAPGTYLPPPRSTEEDHG